MKKFLRLFYIMLMTFATTQTLWAYGSGIIGQTTAGCTCHSGSSSSNTTLSLSGASTTLSPGQTVTYTFTIQNSVYPRAGMNMDFVNSGSSKIDGLAAGSGLTLQSQELKHNTPKTLSGNQTSWSFNLTAPSTPGTYTLRAASNATSGGGVGNWNLLTQTITVKGLTLTAPTGGTFCAGGTLSLQWTSYGITQINIELSTNGGANYTNVGQTSSQNGANSYNYTIPAGATPGNTYRIRISDASDANINSAMTSNFSVGGSAQITTQPSPATQTVCAGANVSLSVVATNAASYQWRKDAQNVAGATSATLNLNGITTNQAGTYDCVVSGSCGSPVTSGTAAITVNPAAIISAHPQNVIACIGGNASFSVTATNATGYQWKKNGADVSGATNATLQLTGTTIADTGSYTCSVSGSCGSPAVSNSAKLTLVSPAQITQSPNGENKCEGASVTFTAQVQASAATTYEWAKDGSVVSNNARISGATTTTITISGLLASDAGSYKLRAITSICQSTVLSNEAILTILPAPKITTQPQSKTAPTGGSVTLNVVATGDNMQYQWKKNGTAISGATTIQYTIASAQKSDEGKYSVTITNPCGNVTSQEATLTVSDAPTPVLSLGTTSMDLGKLRTGGSNERTLMVTNSGTATLNVTEVKVEGANKEDFTVVGGAAFSLEKNQSKELTVRFTAGALGVRNASINFVSNATGSNQVALTGEAIARAIDVATVSLGDVKIGSSKDSTISICNKTGVDLVIQAIMPEGDITEFSVTGNILTLPVSLKPGDCVTGTVKYTPTKEGTASVRVILSTSQLKDTLVIDAKGIKDNTDGVVEENAGGMKAYPNPTSDVVTIEMPYHIQPSMLMISDAMGNVVYSTIAEGTKIKWNATGYAGERLANGMYRVVVYLDGIQRTIPITILR